MKNVFAILVGCALSLGLFVGAEVFFRLNENYHWLEPVKSVHPEGVAFDDSEALKLYDYVKDKKIFQWKPLLTIQEGAAVKDEGLIKKAVGGRVPCCTFLNLDPEGKKLYVETRSKITQTLISISHYTLDDFGRRATPTVQKPQANILMFGDSYTLGESIDDQYAAPNQLAAMRPHTQVLNFGVVGGSPNEVLYELQNNPARRLQGIPNVPTTVLYTYIDHHLERLICRSHCLRPGHDWVKNRPYYTFSNGALAFNGFFDTDRPIRNRIYNFINSSATLSFFNVIWPVRFNQSDFDLFAEVVLAQKMKAASLFKDVDFYLVLYPGASQVYGRQLREACEKRGIKVLDYSHLNMAVATGNNHDIPGDGHPSPVTQYLFATLLDRDLPKP